MQTFFTEILKKARWLGRRRAGVLEELVRAGARTRSENFAMDGIKIERSSGTPARRRPNHRAFLMIAIQINDCITQALL